MAEIPPWLTWRIGLARYLLRPVIDKTGIEGSFDFDIPGTTDLETDILTATFGEVKRSG